MSEIETISALRVRQLRKNFQEVVAIDGIELDVRAGECFGLLGPNGAGKTTTVEICEGLTEPDSGEVEVLGRRWATDADVLRQRLGIQLQDTQLSDKLTVVETLTLFRSFYKQGPTPSEVIGLVGLEEKRDARVVTLSGGQKQRLALACALVGGPDLLFLDEPTTGLDPQARRQVWDSSRRSGAAAERSCSPRTTWKRPSVCATAWPSWTTARSSRRAHRASSSTSWAERACR